MAEKEYLTERIKYLSDSVKLSCVFLIAIGSGTISLTLGDLNSPLKKLLALLGAILIIILTGFCWYADGRIKTLTERLKEVP